MSGDFAGETPQGNTAGGGGGDWLGALINAGAVIYNTNQQKKAQREANRANMELAKYQYSQEQAMWNQQNAYNDPSSQMARLRNAGLNPNMIYGSGSSGASGNATQLPKYNAPTLQPEFAPLSGVPEMLSMYQNFQMKQAQINNLKATNENIQTRTANEALQAPILTSKNERQKFDLSRDEYLRPYQSAIIGNKARASEAELQQSWKRLGLMDQQIQQNILNQKLTEANITGAGIANEKRAAETVFQNYKNQWMKSGVTSSDNPVLRIFTRMLGETGLIDTFSQGMSQWKNKTRKP